jgi:hypothetical protein
LKAIAHKIEKVFVEVNTGNLESANFIKNNIGRFLETEVFPKLEQTLDEFNQTGKVARIDSLNLKIATFRDDYFNVLNDEIVKQFSRQIELEIGLLGRKTNKEMVSKGVEIIPAEKNREEVFLFFLENGYLPWFGTEDEVRELLKLSNWEKSMEVPEFINRLTILLKSENSIAERFVFQFDENLILSFLLKFNPQLKKAETHILILLKSLSSEARQYFFKFLLFLKAPGEKHKKLLVARDFKDSVEKLILKKNKEYSIMIHAGITGFFKSAEWNSTGDKEKITHIILSPFLKNKKGSKKSDLERLEGLGKPPEEIESEPESFFEKQDGEIAVQNAGLVLLHPFLKTFFKTLDLLNENGQIKNSEWHLAVQTLHFMATGSHNFFEGNLVFEKFLCGIPLKMPVKNESLLSEKTEAESLQLLNEVIRQWPALKNTSPEGLRQMFFQRNGKLIHKDKNFRLIVERKAQDVLLDKLSWNISLVKIPWIKQILNIEW